MPENNLVPGEQAGIPDGFLDKFKGQGGQSPVTVEDIDNYNFGLSPEQEQEYKASKSNMNPIHNPLSVGDYYPNINDPIGVGQFSGSWQGGSLSATQYVPGGAVVPIGMFDARDAAIQKAAMMKAKDVEDWKKKNAVAPTSKLTNINENISKEFFKHQDTAWKQALKASGGDANKAKFMLENSQDYQAKNKSFYDQAKMGDAIVAQDIQLENDVKTGKKVLTPAMLEARKRLHAATNPESDEFKNFSNAYNAYVAVDEFNNAYNTVLDKLTKEQLASAGINDQNPEYWTEFKKTKEYFREDQKDAVEQALNQMYRGHGDEFYTPEFVRQQVHGRMSGVRETKSVDLKAKPQDDGIDDLDINNISQEKGSLLGVVAGSGKQEGKYGKADKEGTFSQFDGLTLKKPVEVVIPASADVTDMTTGRHRTDKAVRNAVIGGIYNGYTYKGQLLDDEGLNKLSPEAKKLVKVVPMVTTIFKEKDAKGKEIETTGHLPLSQVRNAVLGKNNKNKDFVDKYEMIADARTKELHKGSVSTTATHDVTPNKKYSSTQEKAIQKAIADNPGYSREEIISALGL